MSGVNIMAFELYSTLPICHEYNPDLRLDRSITTFLPSPPIAYTVRFIKPIPRNWRQNQCEKQLNN